MLEIETILRSCLDKIIKEKKLERIAFRVHEVLRDIVKRVDLETYSLFKAIILKEGKEWEESFADSAQEDQLAVRDVAAQFFEVTQTP
jgi:hypothetical protein